ncbi:MAG: hypothetical protein AAFX65_11580 [Cyanobacteria bacterium J06638_7]
MADLANWLQRWNFIERARVERLLWDAFERGEPIEQLVQQCAGAVAAGDRSQAFQLEVWTTTLKRIRRIEALMRDQQRPPQG